MKLRTRLNLVLTGLTAVFVAVLLADEIRDTRSSVREEIEAANRVAAHFLGRLALRYSDSGGTRAVQELLQQLGHVRANEITLRGPAGELLYHSPPPLYKAGREAPAWFADLLAPQPERQVFVLADGVQLVIEAQPSRAILDAWDDLTRLVLFPNWIKRRAHQSGVRTRGILRRDFAAVNVHAQILRSECRPFRQSHFHRTKRAIAGVFEAIDNSYVEARAAG